MHPRKQLLTRRSEKLEQWHSSNFILVKFLLFPGMQVLLGARKILRARWDEKIKFAQGAYVRSSSGEFISWMMRKTQKKELRNVNFIHRPGFSLLE